MSNSPSRPTSWTPIDVWQRHLDACVVAGPGRARLRCWWNIFASWWTAGVDPLRILAITFTEKAAGNMRKKLAQAFQEQPETRAHLERAWVSTVHGFCARLLRENAVFAGVDPEFGCSTPRESWRMQQEAMRGAIDALFAERREGMRGLIRGLSNSNSSRPCSPPTTRCAAPDSRGATGELPRARRRHAGRNQRYLERHPRTKA